MINHSQFYTKDLFSSLLVKQIQDVPANVLDLGIGEGSLVRAAILKWSTAKYFGGDIDKENVDFIRKEFPSIRIENIDGLNGDIREKLNIRFSSFDVAICNPPFKILKNKSSFRAIFNAVGLSSLCRLGKVSSDIIFLAQNLRFLKQDGVLGIIMPDGIISGNNFEIFREALIKRIIIEGIYELPTDAFRQTEAKTHILIVRNKVPEKTYDVVLNKVDSFGNIRSSIRCQIENLTKRMDYTYQYWKSVSTAQGRTLSDLLTGEIRRGNRTRNWLLAKRINHFHTTDFQNLSAKEFANNRYDKSIITAEGGDILVARVGSRCVGNSLMVNSGKVALSDCVFRVRVQRRYRRQILKLFSSEKGKEYFEMLAHGVGSRFITIKDLMEYPIF